MCPITTTTEATMTTTRKSNNRHNNNHSCMNSKLDQAIYYYTCHPIQWNIKLELLYPSIQLPLEHWINVVIPRFTTTICYHCILIQSVICGFDTSTTSTTLLSSHCCSNSSGNHNSDNKNNNNKMIHEKRKRVSIVSSICVHHIW